MGEDELGLFAEVPALNLAVGMRVTVSTLLGPKTGEIKLIDDRAEGRTIWIDFDDQTQGEINIYRVVATDVPPSPGE